MVKNPSEIKFKLQESINFFLPSIEYVVKRYEDWCFFQRNQNMFWYYKNLGVLRPYYDLNHEFRDILHSVKDIIADAYKSLYFVVEFYAYKLAGKQDINKIMRTGIAALKKDGSIVENEAALIGKLAGCRNRIAHDVNYTLSYALDNRYQIQNVLLNFMSLIDSKCSDSDIENFCFEDRYFSMNEQFVEELAKCLSDLIWFDTMVG